MWAINSKEIIMFSSKFTKILFVGALTAVLGSTALATNIVAPFGTPAPGTSAQRSIDLLPNTKYVNVEQGQVIKFSSAGKTFTWNFDTLGTPNFDLAKIAPKDINVGNIHVYVGTNSLYADR